MLLHRFPVLDEVFCSLSCLLHVQIFSVFVLFLSNCCLFGIVIKSSVLRKVLSRVCEAPLLGCKLLGSLGFRDQPCAMPPVCVCALQPPFPLHSQPGCTNRGPSEDLPAEQVGHRGSAVEPTRQLRVLFCSFGESTHFISSRAHPVPWFSMGGILHAWKAAWS